MKLLIIFLFLAPKVSMRDSEKFVEQLIKSQKYSEALNRMQKDLSEYTETAYFNEAIFRRNELLFDAGRKKEFIKNSEKLLKKVRGTYLEPELYYEMALFYLTGGFLKEADAYIEKLEQFPDYKNSSRMFFLRGLKQYRETNYKESIKLFEKSKVPNAGLFEGRALSLTGKARKAIEIYRNLLADYSSTPLEGAIKYGIIEALFVYGDYQGVVLKGMEFLQMFPDHPLFDYVRYMVGVAQYKVRNYDESIKYFLPLAGKMQFEFAPFASYFVGSAKMREGKYTDAVKYFQQARGNATFYDLSVLSFLRIAECYLKMGDTTNLTIATQQLKAMLPGGILGGVGPYFSGAVYYTTLKYKVATSEFLDLIQNNYVSVFRFPAIAFYFSSLIEQRKYEKLCTISNLFEKELSDTTDTWAGWALLCEAEGLYRTERIEKAEKIYLALKQKYRSRQIAGQVESGLGWCYIENKRYDAAKKMFDEVAEIYSDTVLIIQSHMGLGVVDFNQGDYKSAFKEFSAIANTFPNLVWLTPYALYYKGLSLYAMKDYGDAVKVWEQVVNGFGNSDIAQEASYRLADTYSKAGEYEKSDTYSKLLINSFPGSKRTPRAQMLIAQNAFNEHRYEKAIEEYNNFLMHYPDDELAPAAQQGMSQAFYYLSQNDTAALQKFVQKFPTSEYAAQAVYDRAVKFYNAKDYKDAANYFMTLAIDYPKSEKADEALLYAGQLYMSLKSYNNAISAYKKYIDFYPSGKKIEQAYFNIGVAYLETKNYTGAIFAFKTLIANYPTSQQLAKSYKNLGIAYVETNSPYDAVNALKKAASLYEQSGSSAEALDIYKYIYSIAPNADIKKFAENKIKEEQQ